MLFILQEISLHNPRSFIIITELCDCNFKTFIMTEKYKHLQLQMRKRMCHEMLSGLYDLHRNNIIHGNIKVRLYILYIHQAFSTAVILHSFLHKRTKLGTHAKPDKKRS